MRAMVMDYSNDEKTYDIDDQFMFGPAFMACPVHKYKARERKVYFPSGVWYDFYSGKCIQGGTAMDVDAPYERMPLFVRAGNPVYERGAERLNRLCLRRCRRLLHLI